MMKFFTDGTWRPRAPLAEIPTPVGERCPACDKAITADDCGVSMIHLGDQIVEIYRPWHLACFHKALGIEGAKA